MEEQFESQHEKLSDRLGHLTYWGDYGGDIVSRYHYTMLLENYPDIVRRTSAMYGQQLELSPVPGYRTDDLREVIRFVAYFDPNSPTYKEYPIYEEIGFSDFEFELTQKEMTEGWWGEYNQKELADQFYDWEGNTLVPDFPSSAWGALVHDYFKDADWTTFEAYWEGADSLVVHGWEVEEVAHWLLERYAEEITKAGNPPALPI
jgi:hypothetical protein